jgi:hypothetical protein
LLLLLFMDRFLRALERPSPWKWGAAGALGGVLVLHREEFFVIVAVALVMAWRWRVPMGCLGACLATAALVIAPWTRRNYRVFPRLVLVAPTSGHQLWISTHPQDWRQWDFDDPQYRALVAGLAPAEADARLRQEGIAQAVRQPFRYLALCLKRIPRFWVGSHSNTIWPLERSLRAYAAEGAYGRVVMKLALFAYNMALIGLGWFGMYLAWHVRMAEMRQVIGLAMPVIVKALMHSLLFAQLRYQVPIMPFLIIFAATALVHLRRVVREALPAYA